MAPTQKEVREWVLQRAQTRDFYKADGNFIGKQAMKAKLLNEWPGQQGKISRAVNGPVQNNKTGPQEDREVARQSSNGNDENLRPNINGMPQFHFQNGVTSQQGTATRPVLAGSDLLSTQKTQPENSMLTETPRYLSLGPAIVDDHKEQLPANDSKQQIPSNPKIDALLNYLNDSKPTEESSFARFFAEALDVEPQDIESQLLQRLDKSELNSIGVENERQDVKHAVLFSEALLDHSANQFPQHGLLGTFDPVGGDSKKLYLNTNIPFSAFICGVQGSGKSHTSTCMIENLLIPAPFLGPLEKPLTALVFNFTSHTSEATFLPCEAVFLAAPNQALHTPFSARKVKVLVSPSNYHNLGAAYSQIPGVEVRPFKLKPRDLNISNMLTLMCIDQSQGPPLYIGIITKILRQMATELAGGFTYVEFRRRINAAGLDQKQMVFLEQRLDLLESFMDLDGSTENLSFEPGEVTIMDLSCPFVDASTACVLFKIGMFLQSGDASGKVVFMDEAHKFMTETPGAKALTEAVTEVIRLQRHYGARVIISTQEPTISPKLIDLCSITVIHRFTSPEWLSVLRHHISVPGGDEGGLYRKILRLRTGEALVFAPSAVMGMGGGYEESEPFDLLRVSVRRRITWDGVVII
ncbi:hypothetical protein HYALB_00011815, partial [Hymenoscyphus albidus]